MSNKSLLYAISVSLLAAGGNAWSQQPQPGADFPEGPAKAIVVTLCGACHDINRSKAGYSPEGWRTVMRMMQNIDVPVPADHRDLVAGLREVVRCRGADDPPADPATGNSSAAGLLFGWVRWCALLGGTIGDEPATEAHNLILCVAELAIELDRISVRRTNLEV
jgi:hypothetical protein